MTKLPNAEKAFIPLEKLTEYSLNLEHDTGKHKARVFRAAFGWTESDAPLLQSILRSVVQLVNATLQSPTVHGERYVVDFRWTTEKGSAKIRSAWIVRYGEDFPRLTSCYILEE